MGNMALIGLMDCNNFFVSCERLFRPDLLKKPVAVLSSNDGCIVARSQEVKDMGIPMGLPLFQAKQLSDTSSITFFSSNFTLYRDISARVMQTLAEEMGECEIYSIDEAFFELPDTVTEEEVHTIRSTIMRRVGIPVSIGVAKTKTLAKQASVFGKKGNGVFLLTEEIWKEKSKNAPCASVWGLGRATVGKLAALDVSTAADFMKLERGFVRKQFGVGGERIYNELHGTVSHNLERNSQDVRQSITSTRSFAKTTQKLIELESAVSYHITHAAKKLREKDLLCSRLYIELRASRHSDFSHRRGGAEIVLPESTNNTGDLLSFALQKVREIYDPDIPYKKAGVVCSGLIPSSFVPRSLFTEHSKDSTVNVIDSVVDRVTNKFGMHALHFASVLDSGARSSMALRSKEYTTSWGDIPSVHAK
jgi:DNA polymerase V